MPTYTSKFIKPILLSRKLLCCVDYDVVNHILVANVPNMTLTIWLIYTYVVATLTTNRYSN